MWLHHVDRLSIDFCRMLHVFSIFLPVVYIVKSSANNKHLVGGLMHVVMSLIAMRNNVTLMTDPCGTPFSTLFILEIYLLIFTYIFLFVTKFLKMR